MNTATCHSQSRRALVLTAVVLSLARQIPAVDKISFPGREPLYGRIVWEGTDSVVVERRWNDTVAALADIDSLTYSADQFTTRYRMVSFGPGYSVMRGNKTLEFENVFDLEAGDTVRSGQSQPLALLFKSGTQVRLSANSTVVVTNVREPENTGGKTLIEITLVEGNVCATELEASAEEVELRIMTPGALIRPHKALFLVSYNEMEMNTVVSAIDGSAGVQLERSSLGEVLINAGERVAVSAKNQKVMQDEITAGDVAQLDSAQIFFSRRGTGRVIAPRFKDKREKRLCLIRGDMVVYSREKLWLMPAVGAGLDLYGENQAQRFNATAAAGYNMFDWLADYVNVGYHYAGYEFTDSTGAVFEKQSDMLSITPGLFGFTVRWRIFLYTGVSWMSRIYLDERIDSERQEPPDRYVSTVNVDVGGGLRLPVFNPNAGLCAGIDENGFTLAVTTHLTVHLFSDRVILGIEAKADVSYEDPRLMVGVNLGSAILN
jgi:hypothetical protein